jgi:hypothetical protein
MHQTLLILHFIGLALGLGTSFAMFTLGLSMRNLPPQERGALFQRVSVLSKNGSWGLLLLLASGLGMFFLKGPKTVFAWGGGAFHAKLTLVVILVGLVGYMQVLGKRAREKQDTAAMAKLPLLGRIGMLISVTIVVLAVIAFG